MAEDRALLNDIRRAHEGSGSRYGSPRVHATLRAHGRQVGRGRVERLMRRHGVRGLLARRHQVQTTDSSHPFPVAPNLLDRQFAATTKPNQVWLADLTYIATGEGWLYVAAIMDQHTDVWQGGTYWAAGPWWGNDMHSIEPSGGVDKPQMGVLTQHLAMS